MLMRHQIDRSTPLFPLFSIMPLGLLIRVATANKRGNSYQLDIDQQRDQCERMRPTFYRVIEKIQETVSESRLTHKLKEYIVLPQMIFISDKSL